MAKLIARRPNMAWRIHRLTNMTKQASGDYYEDNMFFSSTVCAKKCKYTSKTFCRCRLVRELLTKALFKQWIRYSKKHHTISSFPGVTMDQLVDLQKCFQVNIQIFNIREDGVGTRVWGGASKPGWSNLNLLVHEKHFCYINNVDSFVHHFRCE